MHYTSDKKPKCAPMLLAAMVGSMVLLGFEIPNALAVVNGLPTVNPIADQVVDELALMTFTATASDPEGQTLTFSLQNTPYGASINSTTGVFTWTPTEEQGPGVYSIDVIVSDGYLISSESVMIIVNDIGSNADGPGNLSQEPDLNPSELLQTDLFAQPSSILLDGTTSLTQMANPAINGQLMALTVFEPDGDVCGATGLSAGIPLAGLSKEYPTDFALVSNSGDGACDTGDIGTYQAQSQVETDNGSAIDTAQFETESPFVLPESPIGLIALVATSLVALGAFVFLKNRGTGITRMGF
ncbi:MAG TPA: putative Ig domain-containing protein [Nitrososphaera sp.]